MATKTEIKYTYTFNGESKVFNSFIRLSEIAATKVVDGEAVFSHVARDYTVIPLNKIIYWQKWNKADLRETLPFTLYFGRGYIIGISASEAMLLEAEYEVM